MTEKEKMLAGEIYNCGDAELMEIWNRGKNLMRLFNNLDYSDRKEQMRILDELLGSWYGGSCKLRMREDAD